LIGILQICAGMPVLPPDASSVADLDGDGRIGWAEALHLLQRLARLRQ
jgi:hypothetical protein